MLLLQACIAWVAACTTSSPSKTYAADPYLAKASDANTANIMMVCGVLRVHQVAWHRANTPQAPLQWKNTNASKHKNLHNLCTKTIEQ
jgi:hypothetical protein